MKVPCWLGGVRGKSDGFQNSLNSTDLSNNDLVSRPLGEILDSGKKDFENFVKGFDAFA